MSPVAIGLVGCGAISSAYFKNAKSLSILKFVACSDIDMDRAKARAKEFGVPKVCTVDELMADDSIEIVLNLTIPKAHASVALQAIESGKHTYSEKPFGVNREEGIRVLQAAQKKNVRVGCAPDTFLGAGIQTARKVIDDGAIGQPVAFSAFMLSRGVENWHPNPEFYYEVGGGPMFDMGPYYVTALLNLLGPVKRICAAASIAIPKRMITSQPKAGKAIQVETPDHICGLMEFQNGAAGTITTSFAVMHGEYDHKCPIIIYGTDATLKVPDPNNFDGLVYLRKAADDAWRELPHAFPTGYGRSVGLADMAHAIRSGRRHRANEEQAFAVLDIMQGFLDSSRDGRFIAPASTFTRLEPMPVNLPFGILD